MSAGDDAALRRLYRDFISGCHILHYHNVLDAFGHLSFRHPSKPDVFVMSRNAAPGTVSSLNDLIEYYIDDARPVDPNASAGFLERCIHSECYKRYSGVNSVIHSHSEAVVPYTISGVPLRAVFHMGGFLGTQVPIWDIADAVKQDDIPDLLVRNSHLGKSLADSFSGAGSDAQTAEPLPENVVVLMRGHGFTVVAENIQDCVVRAVYAQKNAAIQTTALTTRAADPARTDQIKYLSKQETEATTQMLKVSAHRPWNLWLREVEACNLYTNSA